jgi:G6PDH family F420-dependent oxidoreductase
MPRFGYKLQSEEHGPRELVANAQRAEEEGFDFTLISDHYHPWLESQGHASFAWSVLGAIAAGTRRIEIGTGLTCPIMRYHPAIVAQAAATVAVLSGGRLTLQVGAGERLNEHVVGEGWPGTPVRHAMLGEAVDIIRLLWQGGSQRYEGQYFDLDDARLYDLPAEPPPLIMGISGPASAQLAAHKADGIVATEPKPDITKAYADAGGAGPKYCEQVVAYAASDDEGLALAHERARFGVPGWKVMSELPNVRNFEAATETVRPEDLAETAAYGPDPERYVEGVTKYLDAGFEHVCLVPVGSDQEGFFRFWRAELQPRLRKL